MLITPIKIINKLGLHARASAKLTQVANQFESDIWIEKNDKKVNAKSIMGIMMLAAAKGTKLKFETNCANSADFEKEMTELFAARFQDE